MIRQSKVSDAEQVNIYFQEAREYFRKCAVNQWQGIYPNQESVIEDSKVGNGYIYEQDGIVKAYFFLVFDEDPTYKQIYQGKWKTPKQYGVIHRIVVGMKYRREGIAEKIFHYAIEQARQKNSNLRIDTHKDNIPMQKLIEKNLFEYCGIIHLADGSERLAYEKEI
ncbi:MAG: hypothetical protein ATN31_01225 [Candidatus Epulonipiscioides saccharophilum]|nr:MAG: hypothetical protein ATN31_01225 [Epulopiscium sp. AS2M-Bin001]